MFSHSEVGAIAGCFVMFVALAEKADEAGVHWARREQMKARLERRYPAARVTSLSSGHWLFTDVASGRTITEVTPPDCNLSA
jgi:hypothetical protein